MHGCVALPPNPTTSVAASRGSMWPPTFHAYIHCTPSTDSIQHPPTHLPILLLLSMTSMRTQVEQNFSDFFDAWVAQLEDLVKHLLIASKHPVTNEPDLQILVSKLTAHFKLYYTVKWAHAHQDVLAFFSPAWLSPLEIAYTWVTGWKPSMAFRLVANVGIATLPPMSDDQAKKIEELRLRIKSEEEKVDREMERQQMAMADQQMVQLSRLETRRRNGELLVGQVEGLVEVAIKTLLVGLERTMKAADCVRLKTLKGILEVLSPLQCVNFLASISLLQIRLRTWGKRKAAQKYEKNKQQ